MPGPDCPWQASEAAEELADRAEANIGLCANTAPDFYQEPALALASLLRMMTCFPGRGSPALAQSISGHLQLLISDGRQHPALRLCAAELLPDWAQLTALAALPVPPGSGTESAFH